MQQVQTHTILKKHQQEKKQKDDKSGQKRRKLWALAVVIKAEPKIFASPQILFPGARDGQN